MKRRVVIAFLVVFTLWPLAHRAMVAKYETNPWKLFGWAMFCVPNPRAHVRLYEAKGEDFVRFEGTFEDRVAASAYAFRRGILGTLVSPDELGRKLLEHHPEMDGVAVAVDRYQVDPRTARLKWERVETSVFRRP